MIDVSSTWIAAGVGTQRACRRPKPDSVSEDTQNVRPRPRRGAKVALVRALPNLRVRFLILLVALVGTGFLPLFIAHDAYGKAHGFAHRVERAGSLRYRMLWLLRHSQPGKSLSGLAEQRRLMAALISGDPADGLPPCGSEEICARLDDHLARWDTELAPRIRAVVASGQRDPILEAGVDAELAQLEQTVQLDAKLSERRIEDIHTVGLWGTIGSLVLVGLVGFGVWEVFSRIRKLGVAARDDDEPSMEAQADARDEIGSLARALGDSLRQERARRQAERRRVREISAQQSASRSCTAALNAWLDERVPIDPALDRIAAATGHRRARLAMREAEATSGEGLPLTWGNHVLGTLVLEEPTRARTETDPAVLHGFVQMLTVACLARRLLDEREQRRRLAALLAGATSVDTLPEELGELLRVILPHERATVCTLDERGRSERTWTYGSSEDDVSARLDVELCSQGSRLGVLSLERSTEFSGDDVDVAHSLAPIFASALLRMKLQVQLQEVEHWSALGAFGRHFAHELKNPLNGLVLTLTLLERRCRRADGPVADLVEHARAMREEVMRLVQLTNELVDMIPTAGGAAEGRVDLRQVVVQALEQLEEAFDASRTELVTEIGNEPAWVRGDAHGVGRVVRQLLDDSLGRLREASVPRVHVALHQLDGEWRLDVDRSGPPFSDVAELFTPGSERGTTGTGMELALSRRLARAFGGELSAENLAEQHARLTLALRAAELVAED